MGRRIRKHANPFQVLTRLGVLDRRAVFGREAPLEVDLGCGNAAFLFERAQNHPERDFVGLEIRQPLVEASMARVEREGPPNLRVYYASSAENLALAEPGVVQLFHVHFPDPCFKKRHWKRRILSPAVVRRMAELLPLGGQIFVQSDVALLAEEMRDFLLAETALAPRLPLDMRVPSPFSERTSWERRHEVEGEPIYRMLFEKTREPSGAVPELPFRHTDPQKLASEVG